MNKTGILILTGVMLLGCGGPQTEQPQQIPASESVKSEIQSESAQERMQALTVGVQSLQQGDAREAIKHFDEAIKNDPTKLDSYMILGETYMRLKDYPRAVDTFTAATRVAPEQGEIYYLLALNYGLMGDKESAKEHIQKSIELFRVKEDQENFLKSVAFLQGLLESEKSETEGQVVVPAAPAQPEK